MALLAGSGISRRIGAEAARLGLSPIVAAGVVMAFLYWARIFVITFFVAVAIAFMLEPFVGLLMRARFPRSLASFVVCSVALGALYLIGLGAYTQAAGLVEDFQDNYAQRVSELIARARTSIEQMEEATYKIIVPAKQQQIQQQQQADPARARRKKKSEAPPAPVAPPPIQEVRIHSDRAPIIDYLYSRLGSLYQTLLMASFVPFLVYFMLSWRDHIHRSFLQFFEGEDRVVAAKSLQGIAGMVRAFVVGNFALGLLLAALSSLAFWKFGLPYPMLVGPLSGFFSLVPYVGLPLALAPPLVVMLTVYNGISSYLIVAAMVALFHIVALNLLYPKLVGSRVHLNPLVVTVALMFWGFLWDAAGLVLAIPLTAGIKAVCDNVKSLRSYGKLLGD
ncbi:MAG: AI-2E family transporter [Candidatus Solibacter usitatus]|nr:AI-2E family transporter [Candidatus Solibacter usitatus]